MTSESTRPPNVDVSDCTDSDLRASALVYAQLASSLREIVRLRTSLGELRQKLDDAEQSSTKHQYEITACKEKFQLVEDELQRELGDVKSSKADLELRLESTETKLVDSERRFQDSERRLEDSERKLEDSERKLEDTETRLKAAERLLGEYVIKNNQLEASQTPGPGRTDPSVAPSALRKRARSPSLEIIESSYPTPARGRSVSVKKSFEAPPATPSLDATCTTATHPESQVDYLPTPPSTSNVEENLVPSVKRRKIGIDDEPSNIVSRVNDTVNNVSSIPPANSLSSGTESPSHHKTKENTDAMDVDSTRAEPRRTVYVNSSLSATIRSTINQAISSPATNVPFPLLSVPPTPMETSANSAPTTNPATTSPSHASQPTTTAPPGSLSSISTPSIDGRVSTQATAVNSPPPPTTSGSVPVATPKVPTRPLDNVAAASTSSATERPPPPAMPSMPMNTSTSSQVTTTTTIGASSSISTPNVNDSVPRPSLAQTTVQPPAPPSATTGVVPGLTASGQPAAPPPTTTGVALLTKPNVPTYPPPDNAASISSEKQMFPPIVSTNSASTAKPSQPTTTKPNALSGSISTPSMQPSVLRPNPAQAAPVQPPPPTGVVPVTKPNVSTRPPPDNVAAASTSSANEKSSLPVTSAIAAPITKPSHPTTTTTNSAAQTAGAQPSTGVVPVTKPNIPLRPPPAHVAPASTSTANVVQNNIVRTTEKPSPSASRAAAAHPKNGLPACSTSTSQNSNTKTQLSYDKGKQVDNSSSKMPEASSACQFLDTSCMPPVVASIVKKYLPTSNTKILPIVPSPGKTEVPRAFLMAAYGGNSRTWLQYLRKDKNPKGTIERRLVFPQFTLNPAMPRSPGHPGLIFASRHEILENPPQLTLIITQIQPRHFPRTHFPLPKHTPLGTLSGTEFSGLSASVQSEWAKALLVVKQFDVYVSMRARIALRKEGCIPLKDKEKEEAIIDEEMDAIKSNKGKAVDAGDIIDAFERGDEGIDVISMICVKYDHAFAKDMKHKLHEYKASLASASATSEPSSSSSGVKKTGSTTSASAPAATVAKSPSNAPVLLQDRPLRRYRDPFDDDSEGDEDEDDSEFEIDVPKVSSDRKLRPRTSRVITIED